MTRHDFRLLVAPISLAAPISPPQSQPKPARLAEPRPARPRPSRPATERRA
jgi:hypothetical protein